MINETGVCGGFLLPHPPVIVPEVGKGRENDADATLKAYETVADESERIKPDTVVIISPHAPLFSDYVFMYDAPVLEGSFEQFNAPDAKLSFEQDSELRQEIERGMHKNGIPGGTLSASEKERHNIDDSLDHGVLVPLYYFSKKNKSFKIIAMSCSGLDIQQLYRLGGIIRDAAQKLSRKTVVIASGDMSHKVNRESPYGAVPEGAEFDRVVSGFIESGDIPSILSIDLELREKSAECGYRSLVILCGVFDGIKPSCELLSYEAPFGIGYCVAKFTPTGEEAPDAFEKAFRKVSREGENPYAAIARSSLESYVKDGTEISSSQFKNLAHSNDLFENRAGVFVSLKKFGELRGCIGTTAPTTDSIADEIIENSISAGTRDPRFEPVEESELDFIEYSVDVLSEAVPAKITELDPSRFGVIVRSGGRSGLLLPDLEGVDTVEQQLEIACRKAGINPSKHFNLYKFTVTRHKGSEREG